MAFGDPTHDPAWLANAVARGYYEPEQNKPVSQMSVLKDALNDALRTILKLKKVILFMTNPPEDDFMQGWGKDDLESEL